MKDQKLLQKLARKGVNKDRLAAEVIKRPELLPQVFAGLNADSASVKYGCVKILRVVSEREPAVLYPQFVRIVGLLDGKNQIVKWGGILVIGNLAVVDSRGKITRILDRYLAPIPGPDLVTAGNAIAGAAKIALAKPRLTEKVAKALLKVEKGRYRTDECRNIALGLALDALNPLFGQIPQPAPVARFVRRQLANPRNATRKRAERFVKKWLQAQPPKARAGRGARSSTAPA